MIHGNGKPTCKRIISMVLCAAMLLSPLASLVEVFAAEPTVMQATTVAAPTSTKGGTSTTVTVVEEGDGPYWGNTTIATATIGDPIDGLIEERSSVILNSAKNEGYNDGLELRTSSYFSVNTGWNPFNMKTQDLMFYLELPAGVSEIRLRGFWIWSDNLNANKWPAPAGMTYKYLESDSNAWVSGTISTDGNKTMVLTPGFKGYIRVAVNTAENCADYKDYTVKMVNFDLKLPSYGGNVGAAKLGGVWFVTKEDACLATVNGGTEEKKLTTAELPSREPDPEKATWTGAVMTGESKLNETAEVGETPTSLNWEALWSSNTTPTLTVDQPIAPVGTQKSIIIDSPMQEGYASGAVDSDGKTVNTQTAFRPQIDKDINPTTQDIVFYIELPATSSSIRINDIHCNWYNTWPAPGGMTYRYLPVNGTEWTTGTITTDGNKQINLPAGFKGYVRLVLNTATNYDTVVTGDLTTKLRVHYFTLRLEKFGLNNGVVKFGGVWFVSKETDTYYIKLDGATDAVSMSGYVAPNYTVGSVPKEENADVGAVATLAKLDEDKNYWGMPLEFVIS